MDNVNVDDDDTKRRLPKNTNFYSVVDLLLLCGWKSQPAQWLWLPRIMWVFCPISIHFTFYANSAAVAIEMELCRKIRRRRVTLQSFDTNCNVRRVVRWRRRFLLLLPSAESVHVWIPQHSHFLLFPISWSCLWSNQRLNRLASFWLLGIYK